MLYNIIKGDSVMTLMDFFSENPRAAVAFSGGVDSAYLLYAACKCGADIKAYYVKTAFQPSFELADAKRLAAGVGAELCIIEYDIFSDSEIIKNSSERCYYCKRRLFGEILSRAGADGYSLVLDGTNASDDEGDRPGIRALRELNVRSPLRECGLSKARIRSLSRAAGLFTWNKSAYACLATRIPVGSEITDVLLKRVEGAEDSLFHMGFRDFRVREYYGAARLQFTDEQADRAFGMRGEIASVLEPYFDTVLIDLKGRNK